MPLPAHAEHCLDEGLARLGVTPSPALTAALMGYTALLQKWNRTYNLTRISASEDIIVRHILDSMTARPWLAGDRVLDAGTGAGLPGIPLAMLEPARHFTLLDSVGKKIRFLRQAVMELGLSNVTPVQARLGDWPDGAAFDTVICRALGSLSELLALCGSHVAPAGRLVAMKGRYPRSELAEIPSLWKATAIERVTVPGLDAERHIVVLERIAHG